jgi:peptide chain release factor 2
MLVSQLELNSEALNHRKILAELEANEQWTESRDMVQNLKEASRIRSHLTLLKNFQTQVKDKTELIEIIAAESDLEMMQEVVDELQELHTLIDDFYLKSLMTEEADEHGCFVEIRQGAGGVEACDWVQILTRMYTRWGQSCDYKVTLIDSSPSEVAGLKFAALRIQGKYAFGWCKFEAGVHRFVRISPFDSNGKRHTSFVSVQVFPDTSATDDKIDIEIDPKDIKIEVMRAQGAGGQHVNTTESAVRITHIPTNIVVFVIYD